MTSGLRRRLLLNKEPRIQIIASLSRVFKHKSIRVNDELAISLRGRRILKAEAEGGKRS